MVSLGFHYESFIHADPLLESIVGIVLFLYILAVVFGTKYTYKIFREHNLPHNVAAYYNRKIIHMFAGGIVTLLFPILFTAVTIPLILVAVIAFAVYLPHRIGRLLDWFQVKENMYEVNFAIAWGAAIGISWIFFGDPVYGVIPAAFISFGDAITGIVRNAVFKRRTKSWLGNLAMILVCVPIGYYYAGIAGLCAGVISSVVEHFEFNPIDDNVLITLSALIVLTVLKGL